jgi:hypothetical protein
MTMLERLTKVFREADDFCQAFNEQRKAGLADSGAVPRGPKPRLAVSKIITLLLVLHSSRFKYLKNFYHGVARPLLRPYFSGMPCY